jgi:hypothetical protein
MLLIRYAEHHRRTMAADLGCPIDLLLRNGRWVILDGVHRLLKADLLRLGNVPVRRLPAAMLPTSSRRRPDHAGGGGEEPERGKACHRVRQGSW